MLPLVLPVQRSPCDSLRSFLRGRPESEPTRVPPRTFGSFPAWCPRLRASLLPLVGQGHDSVPTDKHERRRAGPGPVKPEGWRGQRSPQVTGRRCRKNSGLRRSSVVVAAPPATSASVQELLLRGVPVRACCVCARVCPRVLRVRAAARVPHAPDCNPFILARSPFGDVALGESVLRSTPGAPSSPRIPTSTPSSRGSALSPSGPRPAPLLLQGAPSASASAPAPPSRADTPAASSRPRRCTCLPPCGGGTPPHSAGLLPGSCPGHEHPMESFLGVVLPSRRPSPEKGRVTVPSEVTRAS